ncbi:MAG: hypothetical protein FWE60_06230, partial [Oscillospiraceae bacterium]|nr:hypothetical protein [Oscillospiraceae bacterium]
MKIFSRKSIIILVIITILLTSILILSVIARGMIRGTAAERAVIIESATNYVIETLGLTPTHAHITNLYWGYPVYVLFRVE